MSPTELTKARASLKSLCWKVRVIVSPSSVQPSGVSGIPLTLLSASMAADLDGLINAWLDEQFDTSPVRASSLGIDGYDDRLGDHSEAAYRERERRDAHWLQEFSTVDESIERDLVLSNLRGREVMRDWENWRRDPA